MSGDHTEFLSAVRRFLRAAARRVAESDPEDLAELVALRRDLDEAIRVAVRGQREAGWSWGQIAAGLGTSRQAVQQTYGRERGHARVAS